MLKLILFAFFLISGFCGLLYQLVWTRMAFASFGVITPVLSVVISVFMLGLALGSYGGGRLIQWFTSKSRISTIFLYAATEFGIGLGAFIVPVLFSVSTMILLGVGESNSFSYLALSGIAISLSIFPWCVFMGATFPFMMAFMREDNHNETRSFSFLYVANVLGALSGTVITAIVLIELLGFRHTLLVGGCLNFAIAFFGTLVGIYKPRREAGMIIPEQAPEFVTGSEKHSFANLVLFSTGFCSLAMEVVWTRDFTPVMGTHVYAFALLLFTYLLATWLGSYVYRSKALSLSTEKLLGLISVFAFLPVVLNDPRFYPPGAITIGNLLVPTNGFPFLASLVPFCATLGYLTPQLIDSVSQGNPYAAGKAYAFNILGCILGPLCASYLLLPWLGVANSLSILAVPFILFFFMKSFRLLSIRWRLVIAPASVLLLICSFFSASYEERFFSVKPTHIRRDHTATVLSGGQGMLKWLYVSGVSITKLTPITKNMAHLPLMLHQTKPTSALVICFGMGTTYRSSLSWDINTTAVELVPSVRDAFVDFFDDAGDVYRNPRGKIVIDDGRRFLSRASDMFDVITVDPPPPAEAAGSSLLYSRDFYTLAKKRLKPDGILQQWWAYGEKATLEAAAASILDSFPYVRVFASSEGWGFHFLASMSPIVIPTDEVLMGRIPDNARKDMLEWADKKDLRQAVSWIRTNELQVPKHLLSNKQHIQITDDQPFNEYYILRRTFGYSHKNAGEPR